MNIRNNKPSKPFYRNKIPKMARPPEAARHHSPDIPATVRQAALNRPEIIDAVNSGHVHRHHGRKLGIEGTGHHAPETVHSSKLPGGKTLFDSSHGKPRRRCGRGPGWKFETVRHHEETICSPSGRPVETYYAQDLPDGTPPVHIDKYAKEADGIIVKPHQAPYRFRGKILRAG